MGLEKFYSLSSIDKEKELKKLIKKFMKNKKLQRHVALRMAEKIIFKPTHLNKIKLNAELNVGLRPGITFYFDNEEEIKLVAKYFNVNFSVMGVDNSRFLLDILNVFEGKMKDKVGYDLDGVICGSRAKPKKSYRSMNGKERKAYIQSKKDHYSSAKLMQIPIEKDFVIITGRTVKYSDETMQWLTKNNICSKYVYFNKLGCTRQKHVEHKSNIINTLGITKYYEDDPKIVKALEKLCPNTTIVLIKRCEK